MARAKPFREEVPRVVINPDILTKLSDEWSGWKLVMGPRRTRSLTEKRNDEGFMHGNLDNLFPDTCGIYEMAVKKPGDDSFYPVYVGSTCRYCYRKCDLHMRLSCRRCGLLSRVEEYCIHGSHKSDIIDDAIRANREILVRFREVRRGVWDQQEVAKDAENDLLDKYDYAWNTRRNRIGGQVKPRFV